MVEESIDAVVVTFSRVETADGNHDVLLDTQVVARRMGTAAVAISTVDHVGIAQRKHTVKQILEDARNAVNVQREAPYDNISGLLLLEHHGHVVLLAAFTGGTPPAGEATLARIDVEVDHVKLIHSDLLLLLDDGLQAFHEGAGELERIAGGSLGTTVDDQNLHSSSFFLSEMLYSSSSSCGWLSFTALCGRVFCCC